MLVYWRVNYNCPPKKLSNPDRKTKDYARFLLKEAFFFVPVIPNLRRCWDVLLNEQMVDLKARKWKHIPKNPGFGRVSGGVVFGVAQNALSQIISQKNGSPSLIRFQGLQTFHVL